MIASPGSRRGRVLGMISLLAVLLIYIRYRLAWSEYESLGNAPGYYDTVTTYFHGPKTIYNNTLVDEGTESQVEAHYNSTDPCDNFPNTDGILLVMKTGATEVFERVPTHLLTTLRCLPDFLIFSDMEQQIGPYHVYDALADLDESSKAWNSEFDLYRTQKECPVSQKSCIEARQEESRKAWNLDKYKFLPMMEQTWKLRPNLDWYVFAEADTYVFWSNMVHWLKKQSRLNPREKIYLGSRSFIAGHPFAHGGSGYVISGALLKHLIENHPGVVKQYNKKGQEECCGDLMLALALEEYENVKVRQTWPMFNGEKPNTLPYGPGHWCEPILTMHHVNAEEISKVWQFEKTLATGQPLMIKDLYFGLVSRHIQDKRQDWDNLSDDVCYLNPDQAAQERATARERDRQRPLDQLTDAEKVAWKSPENCAKVCELEDVTDEEEDEIKAYPRTEHSEDTSFSDSADREARRKELDEKKRGRTCFQYRWHQEVCCTSKSFKLGSPMSKPSDKKDRWVSGWHLKGIKDWIETADKCTEPAWKNPELA